MRAKPSQSPRLAAGHHKEILMRLHRLAPLGLLLLLFTASCSEDGITTGPGHPGDALHVISDGAHEGTEGFYFLPPMVKKPAYSGAFDATLSPVVEICEWPACATLHAAFSMTDGFGSELVRLDEDAEHYKVNWHTDQTGTEVGETYRVRVSVAGIQLGFADIMMAGNGKEARNTTTDDVIGLVDGRTLPITFRIEERSGFVVGPAGGILEFLKEAVMVEIPQGALEENINLSVHTASGETSDPDVVPELVYEFLPSPYSFNQPVIVTIAFDPERLPEGIAAAELRLLALVDEEWVQLPGSAVDVETSTVRGPLNSFSRKAVGRGKVHAVVVSPAAASLDVGETQQFEALVTNIDGEEMDRNVQWSSSDEAVATVDAHGLATAVALGGATIEARVGNVRGSADLVVAPPAAVVERIVVLPATATIEIGETQEYTATVYDQYSEVMDGETVTWSSGDPDVVTVDADGLATGNAEGETSIVATSGVVSGSAQLVVAGGDLSNAFVTRWNTNLASGTRIALGLDGEVDATIYWGDGTSTVVTVPGPHYHTYGEDGIYTVSVTGRVTAYNNFSNGGLANDKNKLTEVVAWGDVGFTSLYRAFESAIRLVAVPMSSHGIQNVTNMRRMFFGATAFNHDIGGWDTGNVTTMGGMFSGATTFNQDIGGWDTGNVTDMELMFSRATAFNQDIGGWDTGNVTTMAGMFLRPSNQPVMAFNQDIGGWNTENVANMASMFAGLHLFNQDVGGWNTGNVTDMAHMFSRAIRFNQDIGGWNTGSVTTMAGMFNGATAFNQDIGGWDTANVTIMAGMFNGATAFNQAIGGWDTRNVTHMNQMFAFANRFSQEIGGWDTRNVTHMNQMFRDAPVFNGDIGDWNTGNVTTMATMFWNARAFNRDIGGWDTGNVTEMNGMFSSATAFNQDISGWDTGNVTSMASMFVGARDFNQDIGGWNTENVRNMTSMFSNATSFNQDLSGWCVWRITSMPSGFDSGATSWVLSRPVWGTCPE
jgi:surface protein